MATGRLRAAVLLAVTAQMLLMARPAPLSLNQMARRNAITIANDGDTLHIIQNPFRRPNHRELASPATDSTV